MNAAEWEAPVIYNSHGFVRLYIYRVYSIDDQITILVNCVAQWIERWTD